VPGRVLLATVLAAAGVVGSSTGPDPYFPEDGNGGYQVRHYRIADTYRPGSDRLVGRTVLTARATDELAAFHLDLVLTPDRVLVDGVPAAFRKPDRHSLRVTPATPVADGAVFRVTVAYHGRPASVSALGLHPNSDLYFHQPGETVAMGEPENGPWWFAADETPQDEATFDVRVRVPRGREAVSNGALVDRRSGARWTTWHWRAPEPMPTYAVFFAAGDFALTSETVDGHRYVYAVSKRLGPTQRRRQLAGLERTPRLVAWLAGRVGAYPFTTSGGVVAGIPLAYALETQTRPVYGDVGVAGGRTLMVHELAHQWFGDAVTLGLWRDTWLNEGFATYAEWWYDEAHGGPTTGDRLRAAYDARGASDPFWDLQVSDPGAGHIWDDPVYVRGAMTLAALRRVIGDADFGELLRRWVVEHPTGTVTTQQLRDLAETVSGQQLDGFFAAWLDSTSKPADTAADGLG
jgi:aminopeptidase N